MSDAKLKTCPFCGGEAVVCNERIRGASNGIYWVECMQCNASYRQNIRYTRRDAITVWNLPRVGEKGRREK